jgi:DNA-binding transcriptional MerR regulator
VSTREPAHLSIGEVLAELHDEFPDITISKIRFLESQGLVNPERTPSGYRKFYDGDLARLRWILHQQKEYFLPLKVMKERLDQIAPGDEAQLTPGPAVGAEPAPTTGAPAAASAPDATAPAAPPGRRQKRSSRPRNPAFAPTLPIDERADEAPFDEDASQATYSRDELAKAAGIDHGQLAELESYGLIVPAREVAGEERFDDDALEVAGIAAGFFRRGIEARHLRMYRTNAEREAVLFGQVLMPFVRQRNPDARTRLQEELIELATLGRRLRTVLLRASVRETLSE